MVYQTSSAEETKEIAKNLAQKYKSGGVFALIGPLGAGKTTFTQGFAQALGISQRLISPTFIVMRQYDIPHKKTGKLYHLDLYRLEKIEQMEDLGISEIFENPQNIILIEWAEKLKHLLPQKAIKITFKHLSEDKRQIEIED